MAATLGTAPLLALHFGTTSLVSLPANVLARPGGRPGHVARHARVGGRAAQPRRWRRIPAALAALPAALRRVARRTWPPQLPARQVAPASRQRSRDRGGRRRGGRGPLADRSSRRSARSRRWPSCAGVAARREAPSGAPPPAGLRVSFLDVGQGDATLIQHRAHAVLVDTGPPGRSGARPPAPGGRATARRARGHPRAGRPRRRRRRRAAPRCPSVSCSTAATACATPTVARLAAAAAAGACAASRPRPASSLRIGPIALRVLSPPRASRAAAHAGADPNERAIVLEAGVGRVRLLLTADAESDVLERSTSGPVDVLKVSHHGSVDEGLPAAPRARATTPGGRSRWAPTTRTVIRRRPRCGRWPRRGRAWPGPIVTARCGSTKKRPACASTPTPRLVAMPVFKPAYLVHGDDHGRIAERRGRLRALAEAESGSGGVELFEGDAATPDADRRRAERDDLRAGPPVPHRRRRRALEGRRCRALAGPRALGGARPTRRSRSSPARRAARRRRQGLAEAVTARRGRRRRRGGAGSARAAEMGHRGGGRARPHARGRRGARAHRARRRRASSGCCGSSRSSRSSTAPARAMGVEEVDAAAATSAEHQVWGLVDALVARDREAATRALPRVARAGRGAAAPRPAHGPAAARRPRDRRPARGRGDARAGQADAEDGRVGGGPAPEGGARGRSPPRSDARSRRSARSSSRPAARAS